MRFVWDARRLCRLTQVETNPLLPPPPASSPHTIENRCNECNDDDKNEVIDYCFVGEGRGIHLGTRCSSSFFFFFFPRRIDVPRMLSFASVYIMESSRGRITDVSLSRLSDVLDRRSSYPLRSFEFHLSREKYFRDRRGCVPRRS